MKRFKRVLAPICLILMLLSLSIQSASAALTQGSSGEDVRQVQQRLKQWGYYQGTVDGIYGRDTMLAVQSFQTKNGLTPDGVVGAATAKAIGFSLSQPQTQTTTVSRGSTTLRNDVNLLARLIHGEARGEPYIGKVAVGAVVLNRVRSPKFPNTIAGVIYQPQAFTAVDDGQINLAPDEESIKAANDALNGWDPSMGALYYYNPSTATSAWIYDRPLRIIIGNHRFCL